MASKYNWQYCSLGGAIRVKISSGEDIAHLDELDQKLWTVLSCPVEGLEFDKQTLEYLDTEKDGKIMVREVVQAAKWLTSVIKDKDSILNGNSVLSLSQIDQTNETGKKLYDSAQQILKNLGLDKKEISVQDVADLKVIFSGTRFNGDGVIVPSTPNDEVLSKVIEECIATEGSVEDRSGVAGVNAELIEKFYASCEAYAAWMDKADAAVMPFGANTGAAFAAVNAIREKINDYFTRCRLMAYNAAVAEAVNISVNNIGDIAECPIAQPSTNCVLDFTGINPAWQSAFDSLKSLVLDVEYPGRTSITEGEWRSVIAKFDAYKSWLDAKAGAEVETLGIDRIRTILLSSGKAELLNLVEKDNALKSEAESIEDVKKLLLYYRDFYRLLKNFVLFTDFYSRAPGVRAMFELGQLYIDQRCCDLCIRVNDMGKHADMAKLSGIFLIYFTCTSKVLGKSMDAVAIMTDGDIDDLRPGKNGIFYDLQCNDWDATITKIVDNPVSIRQAFWAPYKKAWEFCVGIINKSASDKDAKISSELQNKVSAAATAPVAEAGTTGAAATANSGQAFDIAKFAGIFAAFGMALGFIGQALASIATGVATTPLWKQAAILLGLMLVISGPSCFIAWMKLRKRNLGPILNANGWAINSKILVNILFGSKLTSLAKYPKLKLSDPYDQKTPAWKIWLPIVLFLLVVGAVVALYLLGYFESFGFASPLHKAAKTAAGAVDSTALKTVADTLVTK